MSKKHKNSDKKTQKTKLNDTKWNTVVQCTHVYNAIEKCNCTKHNFQVGKKYKVKNGKLIDGKNKMSNTEYENIEQLNNNYYASFKEINDETN